jgi:HK97 family phage major capsid protein
MTLEEMLESLTADVRELKDVRTGSRYVGPDADASLVEHVAAGGSVKLAKQSDYGAKGGGLARGLKALSESVGSSGGYLSFPQLASEITPLLRARSAVLRMGARVIPVARELDVAALSSGAVAYWTPENTPIPTSEETFALSVLLKPRALAALVPISKRLIDDAATNPSVEAVVRQDLAEVLALRADLAFLRGTGTGGEPLGLTGVSGLTVAPSLGANGRSVTYDDLMDTVAALRNVNGPFTSPGWIMNARLLSTLEKLKTTTGEYLTDANLLTYDRTGGGGSLLGFPFATTSQIPTNVTSGTSSDTTSVFFSSDWSEYWIGQEAALTVDMSTEASYTTDAGSTWVSAYQSRQTLVRCVTVIDGAPRRPQLFSILSGVRP